MELARVTRQGDWKTKSFFSLMLEVFVFYQFLPASCLSSFSLFGLIIYLVHYRYMAPEVALDLPYDLSVDAYSFGILFWQICSLQTPYANYSAKMHAEKVVQRGERPTPDKSWPDSWELLQKSCWSSERADRPSFADTTVQLQQIVQEIAEDDGVVPTRTSEIRAKIKRKKVSTTNERLDVDTRISTPADTSVKRFETDVV
jgi:hypothetical protein